MRSSQLFVHALSGAASYAACLRLFRSYPLAVAPCQDGWQRSIVLRHQAIRGRGAVRRDSTADCTAVELAGGGSGAATGAVPAADCRLAGDGDFFVLCQDRADNFVLRTWDPGHGSVQRIRPVEPVPSVVHGVITEGMPVPRERALLGWVHDRQVSALLSVYHGHPDGPQGRVLPLVGTSPLHWPPFATSPFDDGRFWEYVDRGLLVNLTPVVSGASGQAHWVPSQNRRRAMAAHGCVVVSNNLVSDDCWLPAGVYMDHWMLREGVPAPSASHLLALPGTQDLASRLA